MEFLTRLKQAAWAHREAFKMTMRKYIDILNEEGELMDSPSGKIEAEPLNIKDFPSAIDYQGEKYYVTDKLGHVIATGEPSAHYQTAPKYLWRTKSGHIDPD